MQGQEMKPIFCVDTTFDKKNENFNGREFITRTVSQKKSEEYENKTELLEETIEKSEHPWWLQILKYLSGLYFLIIASSCIKAGFGTALRNAPLLVLTGFLGGILWAILQFSSKIKEKRVLKEENADEQVSEILTDIASIHKELGVPEDTVDVDTLGFRYKIKNGKIIPQWVGLQPTPYFNVELKMYATEEEIRFADVENVYSFAKSDIKAITTVNKRISVPSWNKEEDPRKGSFKPYKMTVNNAGCVFFKPYYILEIEREGQRYGIYFPCYELATVERLTGLVAEKQ